MRFLHRGLASFFPTRCVGLSLVALMAVGCGTTVTAPDGDVIDLDGIDLNDIDLDGVDVDQDILNKLDIKQDTIGADAADVQGTDASGTDASGTDASGTDATTGDTADIAAGCTSTAACDDGNPCTVDTCGTDGVCLNANSTATCDDGSACTTGDACKDGACLPGATTSCNDDNACTDDSCDKTTGCVYLANAATCEDGSACTTGDACATGICVPGSIVNCEDGNVCTTETCDPLTGCASVNNDDPCNTFELCSKEDFCQNGECHSALKDCTDDNQCTEDDCDSTTGNCFHTPMNWDCDDGNVCTTNDYCAEGATCVGGEDLSCDDQNECTSDYCNSGIFTKGIALGCVHENLTEAACSDGNPCTYSDFCAEGACLAGDPTNCNDDNLCTDDSCDPNTGACVNLANAVTCDDGDPCTLADTCTQTVCEGTPNSCGQGPFNAGSSCSTMVCDYTDGQCKQQNNLLWSGTFATSAGWKLQGEWQIGLATASTDQTFGYADPSADYDGDGHLAGTVIGGNIDNTPHDWYYLTSPVIDLSAQATSTYLYSDPTVYTFGQSLILNFEMFLGLSGSAGQYMIVECTGDGKNWTTLANAPSDYNDSYWLGSWKLTPTGQDMFIPKETLTNHFQFRFGYKITAVEAVVPLVSGLTVDTPQIGIGSCWD